VECFKGGTVFHYITCDELMKLVNIFLKPNKRLAKTNQVTLVSYSGFYLLNWFKGT